MLLGELSYAQSLGEAGGPGRVEPHVTDTDLDDEVPHSEPGQLAPIRLEPQNRPAENDSPLEGMGFELSVPLPSE